MRQFFSRFCRWIAILLVISILTSGLAMAAYLCPQLVPTPAPEMKMAMDMPCSGMDKEKPVQCAEFQSGGQLALEHLAAPPALTPVVVAMVQPAPVAITPSVPLSAWNGILTHPGTDPPYLRTQRLRI